MSVTTTSLQQRPFKNFKFVLESFYASILDKCSEGIHLNQIHAQLYTHGLQNSRYVISRFICKSTEIKQIHHARRLFDEFPERDRNVFLWNAIIRGYSAHNMPTSVIEMYSRMHQEFVSPDSFTFPYVLKACGSLGADESGRSVHAQILRRGFWEDVFLQNGLVTFYVKCGKTSLAQVVFDGMNHRDVVSWTTILSGYAQNGQPVEAWQIFRDMRRLSLCPDWISLVSVFKACSDMECVEKGQSLHGLATKMGLDLETDLQIALTSFYAKCGQAMVAKSMFDQFKVQNVILWNAMISGLAKNGYAVDALDLFHEMISRNMSTDAVTLQSAAMAIAHLGSLEQAIWLHGYIASSDFSTDTSVNTTLIDMYAKCGSVELARHVFDQISKKDVVAWSAMIMSYALHGFGTEATDLFAEMRRSGVSPNDVTFLGLITACSHSGLVEKGWQFFQSMEYCGVVPCQQHYAGVVDLLGRAGYLERAYRFIMAMPVEPGVSVWGALLSACKIHRWVALGEVAAMKLFAMDPLNRGHYVQLSNLYAGSRMWSGVGKVRVLMKARGLRKELGCSTVESEIRGDV